MQDHNTLTANNENVGSDIDVLADRVRAHRGGFVVAELDPDDVYDLAERLRCDHDEEVDVRIVLGRACTTAIKAIDQLVAAVQLPYGASRGWDDMLAALGDRTVSIRQVVMVVDGASLLCHEDRERWLEFVNAICAGPFCLGGGWVTLVVADLPMAWELSPFGGAAGARAAVRSR